MQSFTDQEIEEYVDELPVPQCSYEPFDEVAMGLARWINNHERLFSKEAQAAMYKDNSDAPPPELYNPLYLQTQEERDRDERRPHYVLCFVVDGDHVCQKIKQALLRFKGRLFRAAPESEQIGLPTRTNSIRCYSGEAPIYITLVPQDDHDSLRGIPDGTWRVVIGRRWRREHRDTLSPEIMDFFRKDRTRAHTALQIPDLMALVRPRCPWDWQAGAQAARREEQRQRLREKYDREEQEAEEEDLEGKILFYE